MQNSYCDHRNFDCILTSLKTPIHTKRYWWSHKNLHSRGFDRVWPCNTLIREEFDPPYPRNILQYFTQRRQTTHKRRDSWSRIKVFLFYPKSMTFLVTQEFCNDTKSYDSEFGIQGSRWSSTLDRSKEIKPASLNLVATKHKTTYNEKNYHYFLTLITAGWTPFAAR
jgi:hypothetical protein